MTFAEQLDQIMSDRGYTQKDVADKIHYSQYSVSRFLKGDLPKRQSVDYLIDLLLAPDTDIPEQKLRSYYLVQRSIMRQRTMAEMPDIQLQLFTMLLQMPMIERQNYIEHIKLGCHLSDHDYEYLQTPHVSKDKILIDAYAITHTNTRLCIALLRAIAKKLYPVSGCIPSEDAVQKCKTITITPQKTEYGIMVCYEDHEDQYAGRANDFRLLTDFIQMVDRYKRFLPKTGAYMQQLLRINTKQCYMLLAHHLQSEGRREAYDFSTDL